MTPDTRAKFDHAMACGALCHRCPLSGVGDMLKDEPSGPVPTEDSGAAWMAIIGQDPGIDEEREGRPFVGASGREALRALVQAGVRRREVAWTNAMGCRTPRNDPQTFGIRVSRQNKKAKAAWELATVAKIETWGKVGQNVGAAPWKALEGRPVDYERPPVLLHPMVACNKRLAHDLNILGRRVGKLQVIPFGKYGLQGLSHALGAKTVEQTILDVRGTMWEEGRVQSLATVHPSFVLRLPRWRKVFDIDIARAVRWFRGRLGWTPPAMHFKPTAAELDAFLRSDPKGHYIYDIETLKGLRPDGEVLEEYDPLDDRLGCIGFSTADGLRTMNVPLLSIDGSSVYNVWDERAIRDVLKAFFTDPARLKIGHNSGMYDHIVIEQRLGVSPAPILDTILLHRSVESELPHSLAFVGSVYTDVQDWKGDHAATQPASDEAWWTYNCVDVAVTARVLPMLITQSRERGMAQCVKWDHRRQAVCRILHRHGMLVDQEARGEWETKLTAEVKVHVAACREAIGQPTFNPNSVQQVGRVLFSDFGLNPIEFSEKTGEPSTGDDTLRAYLVDLTVPAEYKVFISAVRKARKTQKLLGTYVIGLRPEYLRDGRVHPDYSAHAMVSQRISSSRPNAQNWPRKLRNIVAAKPGHVIVGADADQLELRYASALAGAVNYLQAFTEKKDPHAMSAAMCFGDRFTSVDKDKDGENWTRIRDVAKRFVYLALYGGEAETAHGALTSAEDKDGNLIYADLELKQVKALRQNWLDHNPEYAAWWERTIQLYRKQGYLRDSVLGMRRDFLDGENPNELYNFDAQSGGSGVVWLSTFDLMDQGLDKYLMGQVHDALYFEVPEAEAERVAATVTKAMSRRIPGLNVDFSGKAHIMDNWRDDRKQPKEDK